jgi:predicted RNA-binding protein
MRKLLAFAFIVMSVGLLAFPALAQDDATFRVAHFSADAGPVDVYVNGDVLLENVEFGTVSDWMSVPAGSYAVDIAPTGTSADDAVLSTDLALEAGDTYFTAAAVGFATRPDIYPLEVQVIAEDFSTLNPAEARVTLFHAIPTVQPVSVLVDDITLVSGLGFAELVDMEADGTYSADLIAGTYDVSVEFTESGENIFDLPETTLTPNRNYFIAVAGLETAPELVFVSTNPDNMMGDADMADEMAEGPATLRVAHFAEDAPAVDIYVNGDVAVEDVAYPAVSSFLELGAGTYTVDVVPAGAALADSVLSADVTLEAGQAYTAAAVGLLSRPDITPLKIVLLEEDYSAIVPGESRFSVFHTSAGAPPVDVLVNGEVFVASLAYPGTLGDNDGYVDFDVLSGTYDIQVTAAGDPETVLIDLPGTELAPGNQYFIAAINSPDNINFFLTSEAR